jgi:hypothetical protein
MPNKIAFFLVEAIYFPLCMSIGIGIFYWKRLSPAFHYMICFLIWNLFVEVLAEVLVPYVENNLPLLHFYTLIEFMLISLVYWKMGVFAKWSNKHFWIFLISISSLIVLNSIFLQSIYDYNSYAKALVQIFLIAFAVAYMFQLKEKSGPLNWMNAAVLLFYSGSLFVFMFGNIILGEKGHIFWEFNAILNFIFQIIILISIWKASRVRKLQF